MNQEIRLKSILDILNQIYETSFLDTKRKFSINYSEEEYLEHGLPGGGDYLKGVTSIYFLLEGENAISKLEIDVSKYIITCSFYVNSDFSKVYNTYQTEYEKIITEGIGGLDKVNNTDIVYQIKFIEGSIYINNILLSTPNFAGENEEFFRYIFSNPNKQIKVDDLFNEIKIEQQKSIHAILENLGFYGKVKNMFFKTSKEFIEFTPFVTENDLKERQINRLRIKDFKIKAK